MLESFTRRVTILLVLSSLTLSSCAHYSKSARQQRAYEKYVKRNAGVRYKQQKKFKAARVPSAPTSSPDRVTAGLNNDSPMAMPAQ